jgi:hypothetical protein
MKPGTVCYLVNLDDVAAQLNGRVVTLTGETDYNHERELCYVFEPVLTVVHEEGVFLATGAPRRHLLPINDPDHTDHYNRDEELTA